MRGLVWLFWASCVAQAYGQTEGMTKVMEGYDDATYHVQLGHAFPYWGKTFTDAWMSTNGFILLYDPTTQAGNPNTNNSFCCSGRDMTTNPNAAYSFMIAPLWTDLRDANLTQDDGFYYSTDNNQSRFLWYDVVEFGTQNKNTVGLEIRADGKFDLLYDKVNIQHHNTFVGYTGDLGEGQYNQILYKNITTMTDIAAYGQPFSDGYRINGLEGTIDCSNALNDPSCPGYQQAYIDQQCSQNPMYDQSCPGYWSANMAGEYTDFIEGDDIEDYYFYEPEEVEPVLYDEEPIYQEENGGQLLQEAAEEAAMPSPGETFGTTSEELYFDIEIYDTEEVMDIALEEPEPVEPEPVIEEEAPLVAEDIDEEVAFVEEPAESLFEVEAEQVTEEPTVNVVDVALSLVSTIRDRDAALISKSSSDSQEKADEFINETLGSPVTQGFQQDMAVFGDAADAGDAVEAVDGVQESSLVSMTASEAVSEGEQTDTEQAISESSGAQQLQFESNFNDAIGAGQSIGQFLSQQLPDFSRFDLAPPPADEARTVSRAQAAMRSMSSQDISQTAAERTEDMQEQGGFTDQTVAIVLIGTNTQFNQYNGAGLQDTSAWYESKVIYRNNRTQDNNPRRFFGTGTQTYQNMVDAQWQR